MYAEFLSRDFASPKSIRNYLSGVRLMHKLLGLEATNLCSFELDLILRALDITMEHRPNRRLPMTEAILSRLCEACDCLGSLGLTLKFAFLFGFFGFVRQSNMAPASARAFDRKRHTCRGDILVNPPGLVVILKWSKTLQTHHQTHLIPLPAVPGHPLCPVTAFQAMVADIPTTSPNDPLLQTRTSSGGLEPLTTHSLGQSFQALMDCLGLPAAAYSLHSLRRGGATSAFRAGVDFIHVKRHGTWSSDAFWDYIVSENVEHSPVARALALRAANST